jgi:hypothetical protein
MLFATWLRTLKRAARPLAGLARGKPPRPRLRLSMEELEDRVVPSTDFLYVGDAGNNTVQRFDAATGAALGTFVAGDKSLKGPRGAIFDGAGHLLVANQNVGRGKSGEILRYDAQTGAFEGELVPFQDPNAPFAPRGMALKNNVLYVASLQNADTTKAGIAPNGVVDRYNATTGAFLGSLPIPASYTGQFNPRGVAFGPDGKLYVSVFDSSNLNAGYIVQYDVATGGGTVIAWNNGDNIADPGEAQDLHRPEGLTFGPDGRLYVAGFRAGASDTDKVVIFNAGGTEVDNIPLDAVGQPRAYGQALLFGPGGDLFVPITGNGPDTGAVRRYDVVAKSFTNFIAPGTLGEPWYLTFGNTDPATLAYTDSAVISGLAASLKQPLGTSAASTGPSTNSGSSQVDSGSTSGSSTPAASGTLGTVPLAAVGASSSDASDLLFAAWTDDVFAHTL